MPWGKRKRSIGQIGCISECFRCSRYTQPVHPLDDAFPTSSTPTYNAERAVSRIHLSFERATACPAIRCNSQSFQNQLYFQHTHSHGSRSATGASSLSCTQRGKKRVPRKSYTATSGAQIAPPPSFYTVNNPIYTNVA